ncbi:EamA family transporter [Providencia sneebia]|uniref:O-acetylserine/cysteine export protein n=1 Tax=Providencia sneebia DSM 19967 TaxID=1141660 RepID=K8WH69_9GAMM|nr:EamA family transporter [Providencia sneebia]EKT59898.1 O-acetylserine/cysteine export protein [Providencia sneebia DSM 19967]
MSFKDILLALCVVIIWGVNFVIIKLGVTALPPLLLGALRFLFVAFPAVFFFKRPKVPFKLILIYGLTISFGQFAFLFCAIRVGMPAGITSVILQSQAFFTLLLGAIVLKESLRLPHFFGMLIAVFGLTILAKGATEGGLDDIPMLGLIFTLIAGFSWACGNITNRMIMQHPGSEKCSSLSLVSWSALIPIIPFLISSWIFEGQEAMTQGLLGFNWSIFGTILYLAYLSTFVGYGLWGVLLGRYEAWRVAPFSLLVPLFGLSSSVLFLGEHVNGIQITGLTLMMIGLIITLFGQRIIQSLRKQTN